MGYGLAFLGLVALLFIQDYFQFGLIWPAIYFVGLIILFLVKQYLEDKNIEREQSEKRNH